MPFRRFGQAWTRRQERHGAVDSKDSIDSRNLASTRSNRPTAAAMCAVNGATFDAIRWLGFYPSADVDGIFYLDEMKFSPDE